MNQRQPFGPALFVHQTNFYIIFRVNKSITFYFYLFAFFCTFFFLFISHNFCNIFILKQLWKNGWHVFDLKPASIYIKSFIFPPKLSTHLIFSLHKSWITAENNKNRKCAIFVSTKKKYFADFSECRHCVYKTGVCLLQNILFIFHLTPRSQVDTKSGVCFLFSQVFQFYCNNIFSFSVFSIGTKKKC